MSGGRKQRCLDEVGLVWRARAKARMRAPAVVEIQITAEASAGFSNAGISVQIDFLILHRAPEPLDKHIVTPSSLAVHADRDLVLQQQPSEVTAGKLTSLEALLYVKRVLPGLFHDRAG